MLQCLESANGIVVYDLSMFLKSEYFIFDELKLDPFPFPSSSSKAFFKFVNHTDFVANKEKIFKGTAIKVV